MMLMALLKMLGEEGGGKSSHVFGTILDLHDGGPPVNEAVLEAREERTLCLLAKQCVPVSKLVF